MRKTRWHPLPTDDQVIAALEDKKDDFLEHHKELIASGMDTEDQWAFNHVCTVLDHAVKIFKNWPEITNKEVYKNDEQ